MKFSLKELRARTNMSQAQIAAKLSVNPSTYNAWETLSQSDLEKIAEVLNVKPRDIAIPRRD